METEENKNNTKIVSFENNKYGDEEIFIDEVSVTYGQVSDNYGEDSEDSEETVQQMTISTRNNGVARYINIKTDSWSFVDINELKKIIDDFKKKALL